LLSSMDGSAVEVDPGPHTFVFEVPDGRTATKAVLVPESDKWVRVEVSLARVPEAPEPAPAPTTVPVPAPEPSPKGVSATKRPSSRAQASSPWRRVGQVTTGVGVAGLVLGAYFGFDAISKHNASGCSADAVCPNSAGVDDYRSSKVSGNLATGFLLGGGVLAATGITLWIVGHGDTVHVAMGIDRGKPMLAVTALW